MANAGVRSFGDLARFADKFEHKIYGIEPGSPANQNTKKMLDAKSYGLVGWTPGWRESRRAICSQEDAWAKLMAGAMLFSKENRSD